MRRVATAALAGLIVSLPVMTALPARAEGGLDCRLGICTGSAADATQKPGASGGHTKPSGAVGESGQGAAGSSASQLSAEEIAAAAAFTKKCEGLEGDWSGTLAGGCFLPGGAPVDAAAPPPAGAQQPAAPPVDPAVVARKVIAKLQLPESEPQVGPPPSLNEWQMAAVGYPLWLWTDDDATLSTEAEAEGLEVSLDATATSLTFDMGDGATVTCDPASTRSWSRDIEPAEPSPTCGYVYQEPSQTKAAPSGTYTVTATTTWEVAWTADDESGVETVEQTSSTELPVGELVTVVVE